MKLYLKLMGLGLGLLLMAGCKGEAGEEKALGPEETVEAFYRAVSSGDFCTACALCDSTAMSGYLEQNRQKWEKLDSSIAAIAAELLSSAEIEFKENIKEGDKRKLSFSLSTDMDMKKEKTAIVKKEGGVWKVEEMTDVL